MVVAASCCWGFFLAAGTGRLVIKGTRT
uniref:Uncharacterized protein n=1 Tax=Anguilla anguilla TaxID=7936 RepID=A0A0E9VGF9_ANGAN